MSLSNCRIVLVRPRDPNNIGAAARAMKNFGFIDLAVVTPHPPVWDEVVSAINATDVLANARVCGALDEAIADCNLALVFGSEKHGLTNEDLSRCHRVMSIPTEPDCPSMNLGQAVALCCYELIRDGAQAAIVPRPAEAATAGATEAALQSSLDVLKLIDFVLPGNEPDLTRRLRGSLLRLNPTKY